MRPQGYNPMRWRCGDRGCFNEKKRPKIELFAGAFPGRIAMSDIDGVVEINGRFLLLEWKEDPKQIPDGQRILFGWLAGIGDRQFTVLCVAGNAETMEVTHAMYFRNQQSRWKRATFESCFRFMDKWAKWAAQEPRQIKAA